MNVSRLLFCPTRFREYAVYICLGRRKKLLIHNFILENPLHSHFLQRGKKSSAVQVLPLMFGENSICI